MTKSVTVTLIQDGEDQILCLPIYPDLADESVARIASLIADAAG